MNEAAREEQTSRVAAGSRRWWPWRRVRTRPGASPGTIVIEPDLPPPWIRVMAYGPEGLFADEQGVSLERVHELRGSQPVLWVNVDGVGDAEVLRRLGEMFGLHPLALEDVAHVQQRPKVEHYPGHLFIVTRMVTLEPDGVHTEQLSMFLGEDWVLTFQERRGDCFDPVRERLRDGRGRLRKRGPDYLAYALLDALVDHYFPVLEGFGERLEGLEQELIGTPERQTIGRVHAAKRDLLALRRAVWPLREGVGTLLREEGGRITAETRVFLRDTHDHLLRIADIIETYRELASGFVDLYLSSLSIRMNEVMKVLTIIATIFIPLTFIAGVYGMNFDPDTSPYNMPELRWRWGYPAILAAMAIVACGMLLWFRRKGWLWSGD